MSAFYNQEPSWQRISFHSMLNNCRLSSGFVLCLSLAVGVWSWAETKGHFCILIYWDCFTALVGLYFITACLGLVRCWPLGMFYWTLRGKLKPNSLLCSWAQSDDNALTDKPGIKWVILCNFNHKKGIWAASWQWMTKHWHGPEVMLYSLPLSWVSWHRALSHFHAALTSNWKGMCVCGPPGQSRLSP